MEWLRRNRSNIVELIIDDMTHSRLKTDSFDCVLAIEVLEHVNDDLSFIREVHRVLKERGVFMMTTPNGKIIPNTNPDHVRHYSRKKLIELLSSEFKNVEVDYIVEAGVAHKLGRATWSLHRPFRTLISMVCRFINSLQSGNNTTPQKAIYLLAIAKN